jgi:hypothetical protein
LKANTSWSAHAKASGERFELGRRVPGGNHLAAARTVADRLTTSTDDSRGTIRLTGERSKKRAPFDSAARSRPMEALSGSICPLPRVRMLASPSIPVARFSARAFSHRPPRW